MAFFGSGSRNFETSIYCWPRERILERILHPKSAPDTSPEAVIFSKEPTDWAKCKFDEFRTYPEKTNPYPKLEKEMFSSELQRGYFVPQQAHLGFLVFKCKVPGFVHLQEISLSFLAIGESGRLCQGGSIFQKMVVCNRKSLCSKVWDQNNPN